MKKVGFIVSVLLISIAMFSFVEGKERKKLEIGEVAPNLAQSLTDISGETYNLRQLNGNKGLLVIFSCNTCPFVIAWENRYNELFDYCEKNEIGMVLVNSNEAKREGDDSMAQMQKHAKKNKYKSKYVVDANSELANAFGAKSTPHVYLFNNQLNLAYKGAIDDNHKNKEEVTNSYLKEAIKTMAAFDEIKVKETNALGCSIKRVKI